MSSLKSSSRSPGLDVARSVAIVGVLLSHSVFFFEPLGFEPARTLPWVIWGGFFGVELFFALSGMLIGQILFCSVLPSPSFKTVSTFLVRRWLRTLPAYYAVLCIVLLAAYVRGGLPENILKYIVFFQNAPPEVAKLLPVSWSLSIEQWAYIWIPFLLLLAPLVFKKIRNKYGVEATWLAVLVLCIILSALARSGVYLHGPSDWDIDFRKQVPIRLDAIMFGVAISWIKLFAPSLFARLSHLFCFIGCIGVLYWTSMQYSAQVVASGGNFFVKVLAFSLVDMACALMLCFLDSNLWVRRMFASGRIMGQLVLKGSEYAYSLYLVHLSIFIAGQAIFRENPDKNIFTACITLLAVTILSGVAAKFLHHWVEKPCMDARRFFTLASFTPPLVATKIKNED